MRTTYRKPTSSTSLTSAIGTLDWPLDIETYSDEPKSKGALDAFKGKVRLVSIANHEGIQTFDLKKAPLSRETLEAIR